MNSGESLNKKKLYERTPERVKELEDKSHARNVEFLLEKYSARIDENEIRAAYEEAKDMFAGKPVRDYVPIFAMKKASETLQRKVRGPSPDRDY